MDKDRRDKIQQAVDIIEQVIKNTYDYPALKIIQNLYDAGLIKLDEEK